MSTLILETKIYTAKYFREMLPGEVKLDMTYIPAGEFWMGAPECEKDSVDAERPQHFVKVPRFFLGKYPITQGQYQAIMGENPSTFKDDFEKEGDALQRPVDSVLWDDAQEFCEILQELTEKPYRLPTEAEWEYACRGIIPTEKGKALTQEIWNEQYYQPFHFGETISTKIANYAGNSVYGRGDKGENRQQTTPVGYFQIANPFGLCDMHGNVFEWCEDDYRENYEEAPKDSNAWINYNSEVKVRRGGSWFNNPKNCRSAYRGMDFSDVNSGSLGFRVAVSPLDV